MTTYFTSWQDVNACLNYSKSLWTKASAKCHYKSFIFSIIILFFFFISARSDMGCGLGHHCKSVGKQMFVWTQHLPPRRPSRAPRLPLCGRKPVGGLPTSLFRRDACREKMGGWETTLRLQPQQVHRRLRPLHTGVRTFLRFHASAHREAGNTEDVSYPVCVAHLLLCF